MISGQLEEEFLFNPIQEPEFQIANSEGPAAHEGPTLFWFDMAHLEGTSTTTDVDYHEKEEEPFTFKFPIRYSIGVSQMKNIPPSAFHNFRGTSSEDPDALLFEFDVL